MQHQDVAARLVKEVDGVVGDAPPGLHMFCSDPDQNVVFPLPVMTPSEWDDQILAERAAAHAAGLSEIAQMPFLRATLAESLRLYPQPPILIRRALEDDVLPPGLVCRTTCSVFVAIRCHSQTLCADLIVSGILHWFLHYAGLLLAPRWV
jgi:cytochrome P450